MTMHVLLTLMGYWIFSAAVGAMIEPTEEQKRGSYAYIYRFAQIIAANADRLAATKFGRDAVPSRAGVTPTSTGSSQPSAIDAGEDKLGDGRDNRESTDVPSGRAAVVSASFEAYAAAVAAEGRRTE